MKAANLPAFYYFKTRKSQLYVLSCKVTFNKSHLGRVHFITIKFFPKGAARGKSKSTGQLPSAAPFGAAYGTA